MKKNRTENIKNLIVKKTRIFYFIEIFIKSI